MGAVFNVVCHDCKEKVYLDKWHPPVNIEMLMVYIEDLLLGVNTKDDLSLNSFKYDFFYLATFLSFLRKHKTHSTDWISDFEDNFKKILKYKDIELKPYVNENFDFNQKLKDINREVNVACILNKLKDSKLIGDWWNLSSDPNTRFCYSFKKIKEAPPMSEQFEVELSLDETDRSERRLEKTIIKKINKNKPFLSKIFSRK